MSPETPLPPPAPTLVLSGAKVVTDAVAGASAVAIAGDRILAVGTDREVLALAAAGTRCIDVGGRTIVPGLVDGHAHMDREGLKEVLPSLAGCGSIDDVLQRIQALVGETPSGQWVVTMPVGDPPFYLGVPGNLAENRFPDRHDLDRVAPDHPVYIRAIWGHWRNTLPLVSIANSAALAQVGIDRDTMPPAPSIQIEKAPATGEPTGVFYEFTYKPLVEKTLFAAIPRFTHTQRVNGLRGSMRVYNGYGTTGVFEGHGVAGEVLAAYQALRAEGPLAVRAALMFSPAWPSTDLAVVRDLLSDWGRWLSGRGLGDEFLRVAGLYAESDYSQENLLRARCGPYTGWAGFNFDAALPEDLMVEMMVEAARAGIRVGSFTPNILELYERVDRRAPIGGQRWLVEHVGILARDEIRRMRDLGLVLQAYSNKWIWQDGAALRAQLGEAGAERVLPMRDLLDAGVPVSLATDNVPPTLFAPIWHVVSRRVQAPDGSAGARLGPGQMISRREALACATVAGATLSFEEGSRGRLVPGQLADLAVLSEDLLTVAEEQIPDIVSLLTVTGGRVVHDRLASSGHTPGAAPGDVKVSAIRPSQPRAAPGPPLR